MCVCMYVFMYVCVYIYIYIYMYVCIYICVCVCMCVSTYIYMYVYLKYCVIREIIAPFTWDFSLFGLLVLCIVLDVGLCCRLEGFRHGIE